MLFLVPGLPFSIPTFENLLPMFQDSVTSLDASCAPWVEAGAPLSRSAVVTAVAAAQGHGRLPAPGEHGPQLSHLPNGE